jgi:hypothetical protein
MELRNLARRFANDYINSAQDFRDKDRCEIVEMHQDAEDWRLVRLFYGWTFEDKGFIDPQLRKSMLQEQLGINGKVVERERKGSPSLERERKGSPSPVTSPISDKQ